ncbi:MAG: hypothetical protein CVV27_07405 [Candidatus Melainabacteria bacterium HGW-Melainabacteria-1]|nr:MAG: hypothetical protein CVV27_07405 [Candidatus Melainabacteria bacterium HGW-Melainabacteria-1]
MKKIFSALAAVAAASTVFTACQQAPQVAIPTSQLNRLRAATQSPHHPDFERKLRQGPAYRFTADANVSSICGKNDLQHVNSYDGSLGQPVEFVAGRKSAVGALAQGSPDDSRKFCSGTLIGEDLFLTASHCIDKTITTKWAVFNYETAPGSSELLPQEHVKILEIVEDGRNLDYAILRLEGKPGLKYGFTPVRVALPENGHLLTIIQHPKGQPKQIEAGPMVGERGAYMQYADLDTEPGSSGSGVIDKQGALVGVHTLGGCYSTGGANQGVKMTEIVKVSKVVQALAVPPARRR